MNKNRDKIFIGLEDIANIPMMFKKAFAENGFSCDYYSWSDDEGHSFGYGTDRTFFQFRNNPPPLRIFKRNPFWLLNRFLCLIYMFYSVFSYKYFVFISPKTFFLNKKDLRIIRAFKRKIMMIFTGCVERDVNLTEGNNDYICKQCKDTVLQKWCFCNDSERKKKLVSELSKYSNAVIGHDDTTSFIEDKSKIRWFYFISDYPKHKVNTTEKFNEKELRIIHLPSNPLVKQSHIIVPVLNKFLNHTDVKIIIKNEIWSRERIEEELSKAHILVNALGTGYNTLPVEAMSYGCVVFNSKPEWYERNVPESPIVPITADTLENKLNYYIKNRNELKEFADKSIEFYYKYHSPKSAGKYYLDILKKFD